MNVIHNGFQTLCSYGAPAVWNAAWFVLPPALAHNSIFVQSLHLSVHRFFVYKTVVSPFEGCEDLNQLIRIEYLHSAWHILTTQLNVWVHLSFYLDVNIRPGKKKGNDSFFKPFSCS